MRFLTILIVHSALAGCSALPDSARVTTFGNAVTSSATVIQEAVALSGRLQVHDEAELASQAVIRHGPVAFPVRTDPLLPADSVALRMQMLRTLGEYGKALAEAADKGNVERLEAAAAKLGGATSQFAAAVSPTTAPVAGPAIRIVSRSVGYLLGNAYAAEIQGVIAARDADIKLAAAMLRRDMRGLRSLLLQQQGSFTSRRAASLRLIRRDARIDRLRIYDETRRARQEIAEIAAAVTAVDRYDGVLDALEQSHHALAIGRPDSEIELRRFVELSDDIASLAGAIRGTR